jgi:hypothetical protein
MAVGEVLRTKDGSDPDWRPGISSNILILSEVREEESSYKNPTGLRRTHTRDVKLILR